ncbi:hypothetical protein MMC17_006962 [Xylographa soralifera]|nr:hypothetical protein [Xylographa soralifera]
MESLPRSTNPGAVHLSENQATTRQSPVSSVTQSAAGSSVSLPDSEGLKAVPAMTGLSRPMPSNAAASEKSLWTILKEIVTFIFQPVAVIAALVFGAWAIKSYDVQVTANNLATQSLRYSATSNQYAVQALQDTNASNQNANQLAVLSGQLSLLAYCKLYGNSTNNQAICNAVVAAVPLANLASALSITPPDPSPTLPSSGDLSPSATASVPMSSSLPITSLTPSAGISMGAIFGIVAITGAITVALILGFVAYYTRVKRTTARLSLASARVADGGMSTWTSHEA